MKKNITPTVTISQRRYEKLVEIESRCQVLIDILVMDNYIQTRDIFTILGANEIALEIKAKDDAGYQEWLSKIDKLTEPEVSTE